LTSPSAIHTDISVSGAPQHLFWTHSDEFNTQIYSWIWERISLSGIPSFTPPPLDLSLAISRSATISNDPSKLNIPLASLTPIDFSVVSPTREVVAKGEVEGLTQLEQMNKGLFAFKDWWDLGQTDGDIGFR
jgi:hypothetical protein